MDKRALTAGRGLVFSALFFVFSLTLLWPPLWRMSPNPLLQAAALGGTAAVGVIWAVLSSGNVGFGLGRRDLGLFVLATAVTVALNARFLGAEVPWRGDEDYHISRAMFLGNVLLRGWPWLLAASLPLVGFLAHAARDPTGNRRWGIAQVVLAIAAAAALAVGIPNWGFSLARYPLLVAWASTPLPLLMAHSTPPLPEVVFRIVPCLCAAALSWLCARDAAGSLPVRAALICAIATAPVIFFYSSLLYLELPAVLLATMVVLRAESLLGRAPADLSTHPGWYALVLLGFIKETTVPFLAAAVLCSAAFALAGAGPGGRLRALREQATLAFCVLAPLGLYLAFRLAEQVSRGYQPSVASLASPDTYLVLGRAFVEQYAGVTFLAAAGAFVLAARRRWRTLALCTSALALQGLLLITDYPAFLGYSRFMLLFAPLLLAAAVEAVRALAERAGAAAATAALLAAVAANLALSPMRADGARKSGWGDYRSGSAELTYPYRTALRELAGRRDSGRVLITGMTYPYWYRYYTGVDPRFELRTVASPRDPAAVRRAWDRAAREGFTRVLWHVDRDPPLAGPGFALEKTYRNSEHTLALYVRVGR